MQQKENQEALITCLRRGKNLEAISCTNLVRQRSLTISDLFVDVVVFLVCLYGSELLLFLVSWKGSNTILSSGFWPFFSNLPYSLFHFISLYLFYGFLFDLHRNFLQWSFDFKLQSLLHSFCSRLKIVHPFPLVVWYCGPPVPRLAAFDFIGDH